MSGYGVGRRLRRWAPLAGSLATLLGLGAFGLVLVQDSRESAEAAHRETTVAKQATVASLADQYLQLAAKEAYEVASSHGFALTPDAPADRQGLEDLLSKQEGFFNHGAVLTGLDGTPLTVVVDGTLPPPTDPGYDPLRADLARGRPGISSVMDAGGVPLVAVGVPVLTGTTSTPAGILVAYFRADTSNLQRYSSQLGRGSEATGMVIDSVGTVVAARDVDLVGHPMPVSPALEGADQAGTAEFTRDGAAMVAAWAPVPTGGWALVEEQPADAFYAAVRGQSQVAQIALLALFVVGAIALTLLNHRTNLARRRGERRCEALVQDASDVITVLDRDGRLSYASPALERVLGHDPARGVGSVALDLIHPDDRTKVRAAVTAVRSTAGGRQRVQARALRVDGSSCTCEMIVSNLMDTRGVEGIVVSLRDITELVALHDELAHRATHDPLTALPNRARLQEAVADALDQVERDGEVATLFLDLDGFKDVNDRLGHDAGDALLVEVADRLRVCVRDLDTVARVGGDEFVVVVRGRGAAEAAGRVAERAIELLHEPFSIGGEEVRVGVSIGIATGGPEHDGGDLLRRADSAMYRAKRSGRGRVVLDDADPSAEPALV